MDYEITIIGGGPAGLSAAIYSARSLVKVALLEKGLCGGQAATTDLIENYPGFPEGISGMELMDMFLKQAERFGAEIITSAEVKSIKESDGGFILDLGERKITSSAVIYCAGRSSLKLDVKGEEEFFGRGVSYCATCDGALFRNKDVAVVGGGDSAIEEALFLTRFADSVTIIHRRDELRATKILQKRAFENPKISFELGAVLEEISGERFVESVKVKQLKSNLLKNINVNGVFIYIGYKPNSELLINMVELDDKGYIIADSNCSTSQSGIYAAGDIRKSDLKQVVTSVSDGAVAAISALKYLEILKGK